MQKRNAKLYLFQLKISFSFLVTIVKLHDLKFVQLDNLSWQESVTFLNCIKSQLNNQVSIHL